MRDVAATRPAALRRRNRYTGIALAIVASTLLVRVGAEGMEWTLWRDARPVALVMIGIAALLGFFAWRTRRS